MNPFRRPRYEAVILGTESGNVTHLPFVRFRLERDAETWCQRMNATMKDTNPLTIFDYVEIEPGDTDRRRARPS